MKQITENALTDVQGQIEEAKAKLHQLLGAEAGFKLILQTQKDAEDAENAKPVVVDKRKNGGK